MKKSKHSITFLAGRYVAQLLIEDLSKDLVFHNFHHTVNVVRGVRDIAKNLGLSKEEREILRLAAWFHDSGLTRIYNGHEMYSQQIAKAFLEKRGYPEHKLSRVLACIAATEMPQTPKNLLEQVICDADLYHLALPEYCHLQRLLLEEWQLLLQKECSNKEWGLENLTFLQEHQYWTLYGQEVLQKGKELNIQNYRDLIEQGKV